MLGVMGLERVERGAQGCLTSTISKVLARLRIEREELQLDLICLASCVRDFRHFSPLGFCAIKKFQ